MEILMAKLTEAIMSGGVVASLLLAVAGTWLGSIEWRMRTMDAQLNNTPSRDEMYKTIDMSIRPISVLLKEIKDDINDEKSKIDYLIKMLLEKEK